MDEDDDGDENDEDDQGRNGIESPQPSTCHPAFIHTHLFF